MRRSVCRLLGGCLRAKSPRQRLSQRGNRGDEPAPEPEEERDDERAVQRFADLSPGGQLVVDEREHTRADQRAEQRAETAEDNENEYADVDLVEGVRCRT